MVHGDACPEQRVEPEPSESTPLLRDARRELSKAERKAATWQVAALCWSFFLVGWGDGTIGPLVPPIQSEYGVIPPFNRWKLTDRQLYRSASVRYRTFSSPDVW